MELTNILGEDFFWAKAPSYIKINKLKKGLLQGLTML
jgi:hypothetical protein